ncbi:extensin family protein [Thioclava sp. L04-15]|uniref:extensin-like domain-containing protein n=1 Tax=Thioclava sp. L04-15 TaxID=1915318 RepID=UPI0009986B1F|nr:extensin family protein [Thioclava sp. L04-15]OOY26540.1 extensin family protein [Thioclava sp. L04-15]TNE92176.1 MAG: extensin family protein [Paracoccaceae bacterium]
MRGAPFIGLAALMALGSCGRGGEERLTARYSSSGELCGIAGLEGQEIAPIDGAGACGITNPVQITAVSGIRLTSPARVNCTTAKAFKRWVERGIKPAVGKRGGGIESIRIAASYACRSRNSQRGAKLSEHAKGNAIDVSGVILRDGSTLSVLNDWRKGPVIKRMHKSACGPFGTVLGPKSDRFHQDHIHVDVASYRSGPYCR